jgi:hypothetical protein
MLRPMGSGDQYLIARKDLVAEVKKALNPK